jgi:hypothetical protein
MTSLAVFLWGSQAVGWKDGVDLYGWIDAGACKGVAADPFSGKPAALARTFPLVDFAARLPTRAGNAVRARSTSGSTHSLTSVSRDHVGWPVSSNGTVNRFKLGRNGA